MAGLVRKKKDEKAENYKKAKLVRTFKKQVAKRHWTTVTQDGYNLEKSKCAKTFRCSDFVECSPDFHPMKHSKHGQRQNEIHRAIGLEKREQENRLEKSGEVQGGTVCKAKRSRCLHLPEGANSGLKHSVLSPQPIKVPPSLLAADDSALKSNIFAEKISSTSTKSDSAAIDSEDPERDEVTQPSMPRSRDLGELRKRNFMEHNEPHCTTVTLPDNQTEGAVRGQKFKLKKELKTHYLSRRPVVLPLGTTNVLENGTHGVKVPLNLNADFEDQSKDEFDMKTEEYLGFEPDEIHYWNGLETALIDVHLSVQASHRAEHVPFVCLVSKLNGMAILGHPLQIEEFSDSSQTCPRKAIPGHPLQIEELSDSSQTCPRKAIIARKLFDVDGSKFHLLVWRTSKRSPVIYVTNPSASSTSVDEQAVRGGLKENVLSGEQKSPVKSTKKPGQFKKGTVPLRRTCVPVKHIYSKILIAVGRVQT
ncbi:uncharacterized protein Fot_12672 [Forsythia ovata]|uniref:Uncharacterized protein n=1 Tax=Forsythia ovata TaxID=205694 RepID=A0ABD1WN68_9LAMI